MIHNAIDLSPDQKSAIEDLLGRRVLESEKIGVRAISAALARKLLLDLIADRYIMLTNAEILIELASVLRYAGMQALLGSRKNRFTTTLSF